MKKFEVVETTADVGLKVFGKNREVFTDNMIMGFYYLVFDKRIDITECEKINQTIEIEFINFEEFVYDLLNDLIFYLYAKNRLLKLKIIKNSKAVFDVYKNKYFIENEIKAVTKHKFYVTERNLIEGFVIFDL